MQAKPGGLATARLAFNESGSKPGGLLLGFSIWLSPLYSIQDGTAWMELYFKITLALTAPITLQHHHQS